MGSIDLRSTTGFHSATLLLRRASTTKTSTVCDNKKYALYRLPSLYFYIVCSNSSHLLSSQIVKMARHPARQAYVEEEMDMVSHPYPSGEADVHAHPERYPSSDFDCWNNWLMDDLVGRARR
jgi:hypothetical protein